MDRRDAGRARLRSPGVWALAAAIVSVAAVAAGVATARSRSGRIGTRPSDVRIGARSHVSGPDGPWVVRTWQRRAPAIDHPRPVFSCLQVGELDHGRLVRTVYGRARPLGLDDRSVCGETAPEQGDKSLASYERALIIERVLSGASPASLTFTHTLVAGVLPQAARAVTVIVAGRREPITTDARSRTFLAVLPGSIRRRDVRVRYVGSGTEQTIDFGLSAPHGGDTVVPGSVRRVLTMTVPGYPVPVALVTYQNRYNAANGGDVEPCAEATQVVAGEAGEFDATWSDFLEAPTLVYLPEFSDGAAPTAPPTNGNSDTCLSGVDDFRGPSGAEPVAALSIRRISSSLVLVHGFLAPGLTGLRVLGPYGRSSMAAFDPRTRAFLAPVTSYARLGERVRLIGTGGHRKTLPVIADLGHTRVPQQFGYSLERGRKVIKVGWLDGGEPFAGVEITPTGAGIRLAVLDLEPPTFLADGSSVTSALVGFTRCALIELSAPLHVGTKIVDASTGKVVPPPAGHHAITQSGCPTVRPGERVVIPSGIPDPDTAPVPAPRPGNY